MRLIKESLLPVDIFDHRHVVGVNRWLHYISKYGFISYGYRKLVRKKSEAQKLIDG